IIFMAIAFRPQWNRIYRQTVNYCVQHGECSPLCVAHRIVVAAVAELSLSGFGLVEGWFAELPEVLERPGVMGFGPPGEWLATVPVASHLPADGGSDGDPATLPAR